MGTATIQVIDVHSHILPGVDDGAKNIDESLAMARCYVDSGIRQVIVTPHYISGTAWSVPARQVVQRTRELQEILRNKAIPLTLYSGMEIALHRHIEKELQRGHILPMGASNHYLLEPPFQHMPDELLDVILAFKNKGNNAIIAHPERILFFQQKPKSLVHLVQHGIQVQINLGSLLGKFGKTSQRTAQYFVDKDCIHYVASDTHGSVKRKPPTSEEWAQLEKILGRSGMQQVCSVNPALLLDG